MTLDMPARGALSLPVHRSIRNLFSATSLARAMHPVHILILSSLVRLHLSSSR